MALFWNDNWNIEEKRQIMNRYQILFQAVNTSANLIVGFNSLRPRDAYIRQ